MSHRPSDRQQRQPVNIAEIPYIAGDQLGVGKQRRRGDAAVKGFQASVCTAQIAGDTGNLAHVQGGVVRGSEFWPVTTP